jgi:RNA-binding protein
LTESTKTRRPSKTANRTGSSRAGASRTGAGRAGANRTGANRTGANRTGANRTGANRTGANRTGANRTGANRTGANRTGANRTGASKTGASKTGASKTGASKTGASKVSATKNSRPLKKSAPKPRIAVALDGKQRRYLRGLAHELQPVMQIGKSGATPALLDELDRVLETHELVKVRLLRECPSDLNELLPLMQKNLGASPVGSVGRVAILYRARRQKPTIKLPKRASVSSRAESESELE